MAKVTEKTKEAKKAKVVNEKESKKVNKNVNESKIMKKNIKAQNKDKLKSTEVVKKVEDVEQKEKNKTSAHTHIIIAAVGVLALLLSLFNFYQISKDDKKTKIKLNQELGFESIGEDISYRIYAGLTDKQANYQLIDDDTAVSIVKTICVNNSVSYTIYPAQGGYKDKNGMIHTEKTLVLEMDHINEEDLEQILNDICVSLNISGVMITKQTQDVVYYKKN